MESGNIHLFVHLCQSSYGKLCTMQRIAVEYLKSVPEIPIKIFQFCFRFREEMSSRDILLLHIAKVVTKNHSTALDQHQPAVILNSPLFIHSALHT